MSKTTVTDLEESLAQDTSEMEGKYLTFWTDGQIFAVPIADVVQIIQAQSITQVPEFPHYAKGIINLRGSIIPIIDVRLRFGKEEAPYDEHTCIIVTSIHNRLIGFVVERVEEVTLIPEDEISPPPSMTRDLTSTFLTGIGRHGDQVILLLNAQKILSSDQMDFFENMAG